MSAKALVYIKKLIKSRTGDGITSPEKALLWYVADSYNDEQRAAWCSVTAMARDNGISPRRVREIQAGLIRKQVIWREQRQTEFGRDMSNYWRFYELDGEPPTEILIREEQLRIRGELAAKLSNDARRQNCVPRNPQESCGGGCDLSQGTGAEDRIHGCESSQGEDAEDRTHGCESSQGEDAEDRRGRMRKIASLEPPIEPPVEPPLTLQLNSPEKSPVEAPRAAAVENSDTGTWLRVLAALAEDGVIDEGQYLRLCVGTYQIGPLAAIGPALARMVIGVTDASINEFFASWQPDPERLWRAFRAADVDCRVRLEFHTIAKAGVQ